MPGKNAPQKGLPLCYDCTPGKHAPASNSIVCDDCLPGYYQNEIKKLACIECEVGKVSNTFAATICNNCQLGKFQEFEAQTKCDDCDGGTFSKNVGAASCDACEPGKYASRAGTVECPSCLPGKSSSENGTVSCTDCEPGKYDGNGGALVCTDCEVGLWAPMAMVGCLDCLPGRIANKTGQSECEICQGGFYTSEQAMSICSSCRSGTFSLNMSISCSLCSKGSHNPFDHQVFCESCRSGRFQPNVGADVCIGCPEGFVTGGTESVKCSPCVEGRFSPGISKATCKKCPMGYAQNMPQSGQCEICGSGRSQETEGSPNCIDCQAGYYSNRKGTDRCSTCNVGRYQELPLKLKCEDCPSGYTAIKGSRVCSLMPRSVDVLPPRLLFSEVLFDSTVALGGVPLDIKFPANVTRLRLIVDEPRSASASIKSRPTMCPPFASIPGSYNPRKCKMVHVLRTHVRWSTRIDFSDEIEIGRFVKGESEYMTSDTPGGRYYELFLDIPKSLYTPNQNVRIRTASYLSDTSWTAWNKASLLPCASLLGSGTVPNLPCPQRDGTAVAAPEPKVLSIVYDMSKNSAFIDSIYSDDDPVVSALKVEYEVPVFENRLFNEVTLEINSQVINEFADVTVSQGSVVGTLKIALKSDLADCAECGQLACKYCSNGGTNTVVIRTAANVIFVKNIQVVIGSTIVAAKNILEITVLDAAKIRPTTPNCLFTQIEWSPDSDFSRLRIGARVPCRKSLLNASITEEKKSSFTSSVVISNFNKFPEFSKSVFSYPDDPQSINRYFRIKTFLDDTSTTVHQLPATKFPAPAKREDTNYGPQLAGNLIINASTLQLSLSKPEQNIPKAKIMFLEVQFSLQREFRETVIVSYSGQNIQNISDISNNQYNENTEVVVTDRVRVILNSNSSNVTVNVTFDVEKTGSIFEQEYYIRVSAMYADGSTIVQAETYNPWGAYSRGCKPSTATYLQTHLFNDDDRPFQRVEELRCQPCPLGASCSGLFVTFADIVARKSYRRLTWNHSLFGACPIKEACLGVSDILDPNTREVLSVAPLEKGDKEKFEACRFGHLNTSELCSDCNRNYLVRLTANPPGTCSECPDGGTNLALFGLMILVALAYMAFLITDSLDGSKIMIETGDPMPFHTIALRILSSYLQVAGMLMSFKLTLPAAVQELVTVQRSASAVVEQTLSFDCTAGSRRGLELFFLKQTLAMTLPLFLPGVACIWVLIDRCKLCCRKKRIQYLSDKIGASIVVLYYLVFPAITSRIAITFACTKYGDDGYKTNKRFLMQRSLTTSCWSGAHLAHIGGVTVPAIILYLVICPLYLTLTINKLRRQQVLYSDMVNYDPRWTYRFGFLFAGYEPRYAWWEMVVLIRKASFVLVTVFARPAGMAAQVMAAVLVLILSLSAHIHFGPYDHDTHDKLESAGLHASLITLPVALLANEMSRVYGTGSVGEGGQQLLGPVESIIFSIVAFSTFIIFIYYFFHGILVESQHNEKGISRRISRCLCPHHGKHSKSKAHRRRSLNGLMEGKMSASKRRLLEGIDIDEVLDVAQSKKGLKRAFSGNAHQQFQKLAQQSVNNKHVENIVEKSNETLSALMKRTKQTHLSSQQRLQRRLKAQNSSIIRVTGKITSSQLFSSNEEAATGEVKIGKPDFSRAASIRSHINNYTKKLKKNKKNKKNNLKIQPLALTERDPNSAGCKMYKRVNERVATKLFGKLTVQRDLTIQDYVEFKLFPKILFMLHLSNAEVKEVVGYIRDKYYSNAGEELAEKRIDQATFVKLLLGGLEVFAPQNNDPLMSTTSL